MLVKVKAPWWDLQKAETSGIEKVSRYWEHRWERHSVLRWEFRWGHHLARNSLAL